MSTKQNISLKPYNTFGINVYAKYFTTVTSVSALQAVLTASDLETQDKLIIGEGSNILFTQNREGLVILNKISGIEHLGEDDSHLYIKVGAGENWHNFVMYCVDNGYGGIENLSLIPGSVGAAPIQNIGAYGVEVKETLSMIDIISIDGKRAYTMRAADCRFGYRDSVFKSALKNKCVITHVTFKLKKTPRFNIEYGPLKKILGHIKEKDLSLKVISQAIIKIRQEKLPDPHIIGNAGSFFKNPIIDMATFEALRKNHPQLPFYPVSSNSIKLPAAWLIEQMGYKGKIVGNAGVHIKQPLVLVNQGNASGSEILALSNAIKQSALDKFGIILNTEVNIY